MDREPSLPWHLVKGRAGESTPPRPPAGNGPTVGGKPELPRLGDRLPGKGLPAHAPPAGGRLADGPAGGQPRTLPAGRRQPSPISPTSGDRRGRQPAVTHPQLPRRQPAENPWGRVPAYSELARCARRLAAGHTERRYLYILCRERTPHGSAFFYVKSRVETWQEGRLVGEDFGVQRLPVRDDETTARATFQRVTEAQVPVSPVHLTDILRDLALLAAEQPARWPLPAVHRRSRSCSRAPAAARIFARPFEARPAGARSRRAPDPQPAPQDERGLAAASPGPGAEEPGADHGGPAGQGAVSRVVKAAGERTVRPAGPRKGMPPEPGRGRA